MYMYNSTSPIITLKETFINKIYEQTQIINQKNSRKHAAYVFQGYWFIEMNKIRISVLKPKKNLRSVIFSCRVSITFVNLRRLMD